MNLSDLQLELRAVVRAAALDSFSIQLDQFNMEVPPRTELGDLAFPVSFELAKQIKQATGEKQNPRAIAEKLKLVIESNPNVQRVDVAGAGYLNVFYDRARLVAGSAAAGPDAAQPHADSKPVKRMVEHTSINPNKAAHIGHVRNSVLGDTFVRILRACGERVEVQNYIDNTGVQVADVVVGFLHIQNMSLADIKALDQTLTPAEPFDYYCWDLYARVGLYYRDGDANNPLNPERLKIREQVMHAIEAGDNPTAELADFVATRNVERILLTMERLDIRYDLLPRESEILHLKFWDRAFERMRDTGTIAFIDEGEHKGCWVMPFESHSGTDEHQADKVIVRSNGTVTYTGKDIAYQLWKLGQLGLDFKYRKFLTDAAGRDTWTTTSDSTQAQSVHPEFGSGATVYNVIDVRQSYPQKIVRLGVAAVAPEKGESASVHLGYEMVALSPAAAEELGFQLSDEDRKRPFIEMSGRKGLGVKADDLIDRLEQDALAQVASRHPDMPAEVQKETAHILAVGALRYFLLKFTRTTLIAFDFKEALSFIGETGTYCQFAVVRIKSIFRKLQAGEIEAASKLLADVANGPAISLVLSGENGDGLWSLLLLAWQLPDVLQQAARDTEPAHLARYTFNLAKAISSFYNDDSNVIVKESDSVRRAVLIFVALTARDTLTSALDALGIAVPERM